MTGDAPLPTEDDLIVGWMVGTPKSNPAMYNLAQKQEAFKAAERWDRPITALVVHPEAPKL